MFRYLWWAIVRSLFMSYWDGWFCFRVVSIRWSYCVGSICSSWMICLRFLPCVSKCSMFVAVISSSRVSSLDCFALMAIWLFGAIVAFYYFCEYL